MDISIPEDIFFMNTTSDALLSWPSTICVCFLLNWKGKRNSTGTQRQRISIVKALSPWGKVIQHAHDSVTIEAIPERKLPIAWCKPLL